MAYNSSVHTSTGYTPHYLMFGREARLPVDIAFGTKQPSSAMVGEYASHTKQALEEAYAAVRSNLNAAHRVQRELYNKKTHGKPYKDGDLVWLHNSAMPPGASRLLANLWTGPYRIVTKLSDLDYKIEEVYGKKPPVIVHFNRLKLCPPGTRLPQPLPELDNEEPDTPRTTSHQFELELVDNHDNPS